MKQPRKRAPGAGRPPGELGAKHATMTFRLPPNMRVALAAAAKRKDRTLSEEIVIRLNTSLKRDRREDTRPLHIKALSEVVARIALALEQRTKLPWIEDRYTQERLSKAIGFFLYTYSRGKAVVPSAVTAEAEARVPVEAREHYVAQLGESVAGGIISLLKFPPEPPEADMGEGMHYPEEWLGPWYLEQHLQPQQPRRQK
jgi:hypothetical protein